MIVIYIACFINLSIKIKTKLQILLIYKSLANNKFVMKFNITIWNEFTSLDDIDISLS